jgi:ribosome-binding ATPase YchF (GTP1/OBG family)
MAYNEQLDALNSQFYSILDDYKKYYIFFNKNPDYQDYATAYANVKSNIQSINSNVFRISGEAESALNKLMEDTKDINAKIQQEKILNEKLKNNLGLIKTNTASANVMISNYKEVYREQYIRNLTTFLGLFLSTFVIFKVYLKK